MTTDTLERVEVDELLAMLDGEPVCEVGGDVQTYEMADGRRYQVLVPMPCPEPAKWIARLGCGHPMVTCDTHAADCSESGVMCSCLYDQPPHSINWLPL